MQSIHLPKSEKGDDLKPGGLRDFEAPDLDEGRPLFRELPDEWDMGEQCRERARARLRFVIFMVVVSWSGGSRS